MEIKKPWLNSEKAKSDNEVKDYGAVPIKVPIDAKPKGEKLFDFVNSKRKRRKTIFSH